MKKTNELLLSTLLLACVTLFTACSKTVIEEGDGGSTIGNGNSTLNVITRSGDNDAELSYPINLYVFNSSSECIAVQTLSTSEEDLSFQGLPAGTYSVYAIGGADDTRYTLPSQSEATPTSLISLQEGKTHEDLMAGHNTVVIGHDETNQLTLSLSRMVSMLKTIEVKMIPDDVSAVSISITPLREAVQLNGEAYGETGVFTLSLTEQSDGHTWKNTLSEYILPSVGNATITIKMTRNDGIRSYSYTCAEPLLANYKINIDATYTGSTFNMTGTMTGATWAGERTITFEFDEENVSGNEENNENEDENNNDNENAVINGAAPEEGTAYQGCYVLSSTDQGDGSSLVTLMTPTQMSGLNYDANNQTSIRTAVETAINTIAVSGISGWRLPTREEMDVIRSIGAGNINVNISYLSGITPLSTNSACYFYTKDNGQISSYLLSNGNDFEPDDKTKLRAVTTLTFKED